ncbi:MAG: MFS transporter [Stenotrophomonas sp.]|uniref:MFS transporter n=1 Tax=Stenotrophomonas sp. TaxID=69392 RepID=UPI003D6C947A
MSTAKGTPDEPLAPVDRPLVHALMLGAVLPLLDATLLNIALLDIGYALGAPLSQMQWVITAYTLAAATAVPLSAWLCGRMGARSVWLAGLWLFLAGACLCAVARTAEMLILSRALQGNATGIMLPTMQTIVVTALGQRKTRGALSTMSIPSVLVPVLGPLVGGASLLLVDWRVIFWAHVPIGLLALHLTCRAIPDIRDSHRTDLDMTGFVLLGLGLVCCVYSLSTAAGTTGSSWVSGLVGFAALLAFLVHAWRTPGNAILDIRLYAHVPFRRSCGLLFLSSVGYYGGLFLFPLYLTQLGHHGLGMTGLLLALHGVGMLVARQLLPMAARHCGDLRVAQSCVLLAVLGSLLLLPPWVDDLPLMTVGMVLRGAGIGVLTILSMSSAYGGLVGPQVAQASSLTRVVTLLGAAIGAALVAMLCGSSSSASPGSTGGYASAHVLLTVALVLCGAACPVPQRAAA